MSNNKYVKKAEKELEYLTGDDETRRLAYLREKAIRDEAAALTKARREGIAEGLSQGISQGISQGQKNEKLQIARKMLAEKIDINTIIKITELTKEEIEKL